ncbi:hypothetical protein BJ878DRAFT_94493 [Calycina marina]|uniref:N-acetyltransferase domain-containing protein n=1 Tax=Calycina marina TaxID=1763456 RepID=A0A9P8CET1_9HELO|nr:hypothetical protein BJ878DRAFT_94493 [Calycina marina]
MLANHLSKVLKIERLTLTHYYHDTSDDNIFCTARFGSPFTWERYVNSSTALWSTDLLSLVKGHQVQLSTLYISAIRQRGTRCICLAQRKEGIAPEICWFVLPDNQGNGIATEAAKECWRYWYKELGMEEIASFTGAQSSFSQKIAEHIGLLRKGVMKIAGSGGGTTLVRSRHMLLSL